MNHLCLPALLIAGLALPAYAQRNDLGKLTEFNFGSLSISHAHVRIAPVPTDFRGSSTQPVEGMELDRGVVLIGPPGASPTDQIRAEIAPSVPNDAGAKLSGTFQFKDKVISHVTLTSLHLRLIHVSGTSHLYDGQILFIPGTTIFVDTTDALSIDYGKSAAGSLQLRIFGLQLVQPRLSLNDIPLQVTFATNPSQSESITLDLTSGLLSPVAGSFTSKEARGLAPVTNSLFLRDTLTGGNVYAKDVRLEIADGAAQIAIGSLTIDHPTIRVKGYESTPVAAASAYVATKVIGQSAATRGLVFTELHAQAEFARSDPWSVVNQLNAIGVFAPEVLIPTGDPNLRYIRASDLAQIYQSVGSQSPNAKTITTVIIRQTDGVVSQIIVDVAPAPSIKDSVEHQEHAICFLIETIAGTAAGAAVDALFAEVPLYAATAAWLNVTNPLNPRLAYPSFLGTWAVSKGTVELFGSGFDYHGAGFDGLAASVAAGLAANYCEDFVAKIPNRYVFTRMDYLLQPRLFENLYVDPSLLFTDQLAVRYQTYLTNTVSVRRVMQDPAVRSLASRIQKDGAVRAEFANASRIDSDFASARSAQATKDAQDRDDDSAKQREIAENLSLAASENTARTSEHQRQEDKAEQERRDKVSQDDPNAHVPGTQQTTDGGGGTPPAADDPCPGSPCPIVITTTLPKH